MNLFGLKNRTRFRKEYITPAIAEGALEMKYPNTPRHPRQQYRMTELAKTWKEWNEKRINNIIIKIENKTSNEEKATVLIASIMAFCGINTAHADEGMWTIYNLPNAVYEMMQREGFSMTYDQLYNGEDALKNAVVNFSGYCSGVVVSPDGLVFTNHHCGFEAIRSHSTVEHDYMLNGFFAKSFEEELPNEDMFVSFMIDQKDVTDKLMSLGYEKLDNKKRSELTDSLENAMTQEVKKNDSTLHVSIKPFYEGNNGTPLPTATSPTFA